VILDLYQGYWQGKRLQPGDRILSVDAKPSIQARGRCHPTAPAAPGKPARVEHEYVRYGALALLAALDVDTGKVFAATPATTGIAPFMDLMGQVMSQPEYKDAPRVFVIVDNGSDHRGQAAISRLRKAHANAIMIHTPVHASWLNQVPVNRPSAGDTPRLCEVPHLRTGGVTLRSGVPGEGRWGSVWCWSVMVTGSMGAARTVSWSTGSWRIWGRGRSRRPRSGLTPMTC
jgi:hypothetical protein